MQEKHEVKEYMEQNVPSKIKQEVSISQQSTETSQQESFSQVQMSSEKIKSFQHSLLEQEHVSGGPRFKAEEQNFGPVTAPAHIFKPTPSGPEKSGAFPFTDEDTPQVQTASSKASQYSSSSIQETSVQYSNVYRQTEVTSQGSDTLYETKPIKSLIQTFEQSSRPPMKYKQIQKEGANMVKTIPEQHARKPEPSEAPIVNGNVYYVASAHVETRQFVPQLAQVTTQKLSGYETSETQFQKFSTFLSSKQQENLITQKGQSSSIQTFQSKSPQSSAANQQQLLTQITGKNAEFLYFCLYFFSSNIFLKVAWFLYMY
jgi:hypothetical protein